MCHTEIILFFIYCFETLTIYIMLCEIINYCIMLKINYLILVLVITIESFNYVSTIDRFCLGKMSR